MNWRRGFFRIWIVLSLIWIVAVAGVAYQNEWLPRERIAEQNACAEKRTANPSLGNPFD